ncbi:MAG TPA: tape measure protein, partial [Thermodesulfobacteriota bacterium]|nr:tape measure protein [Thermodesulfobacteriota bacterium]
MARDVNELILQFKFASANANRQIKKTEKEMGRLRLTTSGLRRSLGAIRNNLLLVSFAAGAVIGSIGKIVSVSAKFEAVKTRLIGLTGSVENAEKAFKNFNDVAATTPFSLDDVVNAGAQLQAFGADAEALIKPITDLAAFMGTTATEAANAFGRAYAGGAGAADILRERGILNIIKTSQGLTDLAKTTLPEFREALIKSLQDPVVGIEGSTERLAKTTTGAISNMGDAFTRLAAAIGDELKPVTDAAISSLTNLAKGATNLISPDVPTKVESMRNELDGLVESLRVNTLASEKHQDSTLNIADAFDIAIARGQAFYAANEDIRHQAPELQAAIIDYNSNIVTQNNLLETNRKKIIARSTALINDLIAMDE